MTFQNPLLLILSVILVPTVYVMWAGYLKTKHNLGVFKEDSSGARKRSKIIMVLSLVLLVCLLIVASGPQRFITTPEQQESGNFVFLIDVSRSMAARESCSELMRLDGAKSLMSYVVNSVSMARFAIIPFSQLAFPFTELTFDKQYLLDVVQDSLIIEAVPVPGSDIANALLVLAEKKQVSPQIYEQVEHVILLSDGDISDPELQELGNVIPVLQEAGIKVVSVGIGSDIALPIPTLGENQECMPGMFERAEGREYYTHLVEQPLRFLAEETGGKYFSEESRKELVEYIRSELRSIPGLEVPVIKEDISQIFLVFATISLLVLVWIQRI